MVFSHEHEEMILNVDILRFLFSLKQQVSPARDKDGGKENQKKALLEVSTCLPLKSTQEAKACRMQG